MLCRLAKGEEAGIVPALQDGLFHFAPDLHLGHGHVVDVDVDDDLCCAQGCQGRGARSTWCGGHARVGVG